MKSGLLSQEVMKYILVRLENNNQPKWKPKEVRKLRVIRETEEFYVVDDGELEPSLYSKSIVKLENVIEE